MVAPGPLRRGDVVIVDLAPTRGRELRETRPCVVVSPDELNTFAPTVLVAPLTTGSYPYRFRVPCRFQGRSGHVVLDQIRVIDRERARQTIGRLSPSITRLALAVLREMFAD